VSRPYCCADATRDCGIVVTSTARRARLPTRLPLAGWETPWPGPAISSALWRVRDWFAHRPLISDLALALAAAAGFALIDLAGSARPPSAAGWDVLLALPLALRRRRRACAAVLIGAVCLAQWLLGAPALGDASVLVVLYSLGAYERRRGVLPVAIAIAELGVVMAVVRWGAATDQVLSGITATGTVTASWVAGVYISMRRAYLASVHERAETAERERDSRARAAVAAERARLAREMHDVVAHSLSVMITLNDAAAAIEPSPRVQEAISQAAEVGRQALSEMHRMLGVLRDGEAVSYAPQPGLGDLAALASMVRSAGLPVELAATGDLTGLTPTVQLALYRIVQESLTNVLKHARNAEKVLVEIVRHEHRIDLRIDNDGARTTAPDDSSPGHGLTGMAERARMFGGALCAGPSSGGGWSVRAHLDLAHPGTES
jgi:signal transduction histidine kinase